jgi:hypothetical protein
MAVVMLKLTRSAVILSTAMALSACGEVIPQSAPVPRAPSAPVQRPSFTPATPRPSQPETQLEGQPRMAGVIGADAKALIRLFGEPRLDIRDPAARKLQFSNGRCVLDAYLYPDRARRDPVVTYAEARLADGTAMDWATCAAQLRAR